MYSGYTNYIGNIQGGTNYFTVIPVHDGYDEAHNLLPVYYSYSTDIFFEIPYHPSANIGTPTIVDKGGDGIAAYGDWVWDPSAPDNSKIVQEATTQASWQTITGVKTSYSNMGGASIDAEWTYGFSGAQATEGVEQEIPSNFSSSGSTGSQSGTNLTFSQDVNTLRMTVTVYCKPGFGPAFGGQSSWSDTVNISPGSGIKAFKAGQKVYTGSDNVMNYVSAKVTGGVIYESTTNWINYQSYYDISVSITVSCSELPGSFSFDVRISGGSIRCTDTHSILGDGPSKTASFGSNDSTRSLSSGGSASFSLRYNLRGSTDEVWGGDYDRFDNGSARVAFAGRN